MIMLINIIQTILLTGQTKTIMQTNAIPTTMSIGIAVMTAMMTMKTN